jgi:hypothetical protein
LYYPSSGFDGDPIKYLAGNFLSFIYVDYGRTRDEFISVLDNPGVRGYEQIVMRPVTEHELTPRGWKPIRPTYTDGNPSRHSDWIKEPFCYWCVFQRSTDVPITHGPDRFSLLYLCADGVAAFQALYHANGKAPKAVAVIQPGTAFGFNWTDFEDPTKIFARTILNNRSGQPQFLLFGGIGIRDFYRESCWPEYQDFVVFVHKSGGGSIGVWKRKTISVNKPPQLSVGNRIH